MSKYFIAKVPPSYNLCQNCRIRDALIYFNSTLRGGSNHSSVPASIFRTNYCSTYQGWVTKMIVIIRDIYYHNFTFEVKDTDTIITLKVMIEFKTGTSPCSQRLIYHGQNLENERKIGDYNIREKSIIDLVYRMSGC
uniref:Ubiquitin-like domain-containing protein n=4 Tax=Meloidogyne TaxID=189290 RepID=A0A6V7WW92_MELEN|nr:unnamed protein product [Meloidogyne enterolobii]